MELNKFELLYKTSKQRPVGVVEPVYDLAGDPLYGERSTLHPQATLRLPHQRGMAEVVTVLKDLPKKGDCRSGNHRGPVSGVYIKPGPIYYQDYKKPVYHRAPLELFTEAQLCEVTRRIGRVTGSDGKLYHLYVCSDGCILLKLASRTEKKVLKWICNTLDCPLWVTSCSDEDKSKKSGEKKPDRVRKGAMKITPKESEKDSKSKPPDATIVVDGIKYKVKKKGKVKSKNTQD
nr:viral proteinase p20 (EC 3.4.-.-) - porcine pestivirus 137/4 [Porcine pestivirus]AAB24790.1 p20=autoprotease [porcine pestivirus, 137/4, Peptide, 232 aa] [Porcine pestivirus]